MAGKSKRYFQQQGRARSRSPERSHKASTYSSSSKERSRPNYDGHSSKFADNKAASERMKRSIEEKWQTQSPSPLEPMRLLSVEEQVKRANAIEEINYTPFQPKSFFSTRNITVNLQDIPLPRDDNSWRENPKLLIDRSLYIGSNAEERKKLWMDNLVMLQRKMMMGES